jgi:hypothetical protein
MTVMNIMTMMYILEVVRFDEHGCQICIVLVVPMYDEEVCINHSFDEFVLHHKKVFVNSW